MGLLAGRTGRRLQPIGATGSSYAQAFQVSDARRLVFVSGQVPEDKAGQVPPGFADQARLVWRNIEEQLAQAGLGLRDIVKITVFLSDRAYRQANYEVRHEVLGDHSPAMTIVICGIYDPAWLLEIEAVAAGD